MCGCCSTFLSASRTVSGVLTHPIIPCTERVISFLLRMVALRERPLLLARNVWTSCHPHWDGTAAPLHQSPAGWPTSLYLFCKNLYRRKWSIWLVQIICIIFIADNMKRKIRLVDWRCKFNGSVPGFIPSQRLNPELMDDVYTAVLMIPYCTCSMWCGKIKQHEGFK